MKKPVVGMELRFSDLTDSIRQSSAFDSMMRTFGSSDIAIRSLATSPVTRPLLTEVPGQRDLMHRAAVESTSGRMRGRHERARLDAAARGDDADRARRAGRRLACASSGESSQKSAGCSSARCESVRDIPPAV